MRYPKVLKEHFTIGVCAPSAGIITEPNVSRFNNAIKTFESMGHKVVLSPSVRKYDKHRSNTAIVRAKEFMDLYTDDDIDVIISATGGEFMLEILPYIDFEYLKKFKPKFFEGFSDNTTLTFTLPTLLDTVAIYGANFCDYGMQPWHKAIKTHYDFLQGKINILNSQNKYELKSLKKEPNMELSPYNCTEKSTWTILSGEKKVEMSGRLIGGCTDILLGLCGTKFDKVKEYLEKYKDDGFIWYLESCDLNICNQTRALWELKNAGWFKYAKGFIFGRPKDKEEMHDIDYKEANYFHIKDLGVPVIIDADFGHVSPILPIISGATAKIICEKGKGTIAYFFK